MLEFYPNLNLNPAMLPDHTAMQGMECGGRSGKFTSNLYLFLLLRFLLSLFREIL